MAKKKSTEKNQTKGLNLIKINPKTGGQKKVFEYYEKDKHLLLHGMAGTGKTFISLYLALKDVVENLAYNNVIIIRSTVPVREMGYLPGKEKEKFEPFEQPYKSICSELFGRADAYEILKYKDIIKFESTAFTRGRNIDNSVVIVDEINNCNFQELDTIITRIGEHAKIIFCGDYRQTDLNNEREKQGLKKFISIIDQLEEFAHVEFFIDDIVRSKLVKSYIIAREYEKNNYLAVA